MRIHTGEKPYKCDVCLEVFRWKISLTQHMRMHTGENPYKCDVCLKVFRAKFSLTQHMWTHTGEKPYKCDACGRGFLQKSNMTQHMRTHTGEKPRVKNKITCAEVLDDSDQRQNNPLNDSNYQLISEIDIIEVKSEEDNVLIHPTTAGITDPEFVDCGETIKHEIKEEGDSEYQIDPLRLFNTPEFFDHSIFSILMHKI